MLVYTPLDVLATHLSNFDLEVVGGDLYRDNTFVKHLQLCGPCASHLHMYVGGQAL